MRALVAILSTAFARRSRLQRLAVLGRFLAWTSLLALAFSALFHLLMGLEGRTHSLVTGLYWTLTTMTTLGFGDITFTSDLGRIFSIVVMLTGVLVFQIMLTFFVIQYLYLPWTEAREAARIPRQADPTLRGHVILTTDGDLARAVATMLRREGLGAVILGGSPSDTLRAHDEGVPVIAGSFDAPDSYRSAGIERAVLVVATGTGTANANAVVTVREVAPSIPIFADSREALADHILRLAGATDILRRGLVLGEAMARRVPGGRRAVHAVGSFHGLVIAEVAVGGTRLAGLTVAGTGLKERGITAVGTCEQDRFRMARADHVLSAAQQLVVIGSPAALSQLDGELRIDAPPPQVVVLGGGRVGRAAAAALCDRDMPVRIVEQVAGRAPDTAVVGDACDPAVLDRAGIAQSSAVLITTHDDDLNIFLTILVRKQAPAARIIARVGRDRNISTLYRAGAHAVLSGLTLAAEEVLARVRPSSVQVLSEGVMLVCEPILPAWANRSLSELSLPATQGLQVIAVIDHGALQIAPGADAILPAGGEILAVRSVRPGVEQPAPVASAALPFPMA
jgi:voltage-gated potassium channel